MRLGLVQLSCSCGAAVQLCHVATLRAGGTRRHVCCFRNGVSGLVTGQMHSPNATPRVVVIRPGPAATVQFWGVKPLSPCLAFPRFAPCQ